VSVSYSLARDHITLHEPIILNFRIANETSQPVVVDLGANHQEVFSFTIEKPDGSKVEPPRKVPDGSFAIGRVSLKSTQAYVQKLLLNEWFEFPTPGQYEISVRLVKPQITPRGVDIYDIYGAPEFRTTLYVQPREAVRLKEICADLQAQILKAATVADATEPAEALSYVNDPIAIPYLEDVLKSRLLLEWYAIAGLERIGTEEAVRVLKAASKSRNSDTARLAQRALNRMKTPSKHP
jgi:hypothetical protein